MWDSELSAVDGVCQSLEEIYTYACIASKMLNKLARNTYLTDHEKRTFLESYRVAVIHVLHVHPALFRPWHTKIHTYPSHEENCVSLGALLANSIIQPQASSWWSFPPSFFSTFPPLSFILLARERSGTYLHPPWLHLIFHFWAVYLIPKAVVDEWPY